MAKKRNRAVSLAAVPGLKAKARKEPSITIRSEQAPTAERLVQAGVAVAMTVRGRQTQIIGLAHERPIGADGVFRLGARVGGSPLERLHAHGRLADKNPRRNTALLNAGLELRRHYDRSGLEASIASVDLNRIRAGGDFSCGMPTTEAMADHRGMVRQAEALLDAGDWQVVFDVVVAGATLEQAGRAAGFGNMAAANAVALDRLRRGLAKIAEEWKLLPRPPTPANDAEPVASSKLIA